MSVIFGVCSLSGLPITREALARLAKTTARYGPDDTSISAEESIGMVYQAFWTHLRSRLEQQPAVDQLGNWIVLDGRLDNYVALADTLGLNSDESSDSFLMLKAFERWGNQCFSRFTGEWAVAIWSAHDRLLYLARDHAGSRTLFYINARGEFRWSTYIETLLVDNHCAELDREYLVRTLARQPLYDLTPYKGIRAIPPGYCLVVKGGETKLLRHWHPITSAPLTYRSDAEYDEEFICLLTQAIRRRIEPVPLTVAELSGGMDSSAIVCVADTITANTPKDPSLLTTISYYDDTEPDWDERGYFEVIERHRNKVGIHFDCSTRTPSFQPLILADQVYPYPAGDSASLDMARSFDQQFDSRGFRVILSGIGGDELLGGVPTPLPELSTLLRNGNLLKLLSQTFDWCIVLRQPLWHMLSDLIRFTRGLYWTSDADRDLIPPWLINKPDETLPYRRYGRESIGTLLRAQSSAIACGQAWWNLVETLPHHPPHLTSPHEYRYPYLDRDLVDFLHRIPRDQLVRPGRRRYLMRRALSGIVPATVLERRRKSFISRGPITHLRQSQEKIRTLFAKPLTAELGLIDRHEFLKIFNSELSGEPKWVGHLIKTIELELWFRSLTSIGNGIRLSSVTG